VPFRRELYPAERPAKTIDELITASSLGTPEVVVVRNMKPGTPPAVAAKLIEASCPEFYRPARRGRKR